MLLDVPHCQLSFQKKGCIIAVIFAFLLSRTL
ncbi:DUF645 family protein [Vibrio paracholerae]|nr:DUF645 family protein [Vibrio paracholerae]